MKNKVVLDFVIADYEDGNDSYITQMLGIEPVKTAARAQRVHPRTHKDAMVGRNMWFMNAGLDEYADFEEQMAALAQIIESKIDSFSTLCEKYRCYFLCAVFVYYDNGESTPWVYLGENYNRLVKRLPIGFDLDLYCWPDD